MPTCLGECHAVLCVNGLTKGGRQCQDVAKGHHALLMTRAIDELCDAQVFQVNETSNASSACTYVTGKEIHFLAS